MSRKEEKRKDVENELAELQRKYRIMEGDRKSYSEESQNIIRKQRASIEKLRRDNQLLKDELAQETRNTMYANNLQASNQLVKLQDQADQYTRKIEIERRRIEEMDKQLRLLSVKIQEQRAKMGGVNAAKENNQQVAKQIRILENRLDKALVKFNEALAHNKQLREQIDNLRRERVVFDGVYKKLERELHDKKREMANIIEISNIAYEARDQAQNEMAQLKAQADKEQSTFEVEMRELEKLLEKDRKMKDIQRGFNRDGQLGTMSVEEEKALKKKVVKGSWGAAKDKVAHHISQEKVQSYEEAFAKIQAATGISDIDELVTKFINAEDQNFSLFNYVNELNNEIEKLEEQISDIKSEIDKYKGQGTNADNQRKKILKELEEKLAKTESKAEQYEQKHAQAMKTIQNLKNGIQSIFTKIGCKTDGYQDVLGNQGVTELNMMTYLGIIEQRTNEILKLYMQQLSSNLGEPAPAGAQGAFVGQGPQTPVGATSITIHPPTTGDDYESDEDSEEEDEERPLTREELKQKTLRGLTKREGQKQRPKKQDKGGKKGKKGDA